MIKAFFPRLMNALRKAANSLFPDKLLGKRLSFTNEAGNLSKTMTLLGEQSPSLVFKLKLGFFALGKLNLRKRPKMKEYDVVLKWQNWRSRLGNLRSS